jgi:alpha-1,2-mannosyltransferase
VGALAVALVGIAMRQARPPVTAVAVAFVLLALWPPVLHNLAKGQWSIFLAFLLAAGWRALEAERPRAAGIFVGLAAALKATPVLLLVYLFLRRRRAAWAMVATLGTLGIGSLAIFGHEPWHAWLLNARPNAQAWQTWVANTASINGVVARLLVGGDFAVALVKAPAVAQALTLVTTALLVSIAIAITRRASLGPREDHLLFGAWIAIVVVANPIAWTHTTIIALIPLALMVGQVPPRTLVATLVALTFPRQTLAVLAGPLPVSPARGLLLSTHAFALLLLIAAALRAAAWPASVNLQQRTAATR